MFLMLLVEITHIIFDYEYQQLKKTPEKKNIRKNVGRRTWSDCLLIINNYRACV